jgi:transposase
MYRGDLTNDEWQQLEPVLPPQKPKTGRPANDHRRIINGMLWIARTGAPWRDLPARYGPVGTVASRFYRWQQAGIWQRILAAVQQRADAEGQLDWDMHFVVGSTIRAHQHAAGAKGGRRTPKRWAEAVVASAPNSISVRKVGANR